MTSLIRSLIVIVFITTSSVAFANDFDITYDAGTAAFEAKDYAKARAEFTKAYGIRPEPIVLYNIAQTYRLENNIIQALEFYRRYLADSNSAANLRVKAQDYVTELEKAQKPKPPVKDPQLQLQPRPEPVPPVTPTRDDARTRRIPLGSKIAAGVTGAGLISALVFTKLGLDAEKNLEDRGAAATPKDADRVEKFQNLINISWGITGAAAITAVVIHFAAPSYATERKTIVIAPNRDGGLSAALTGRF